MTVITRFAPSPTGYLHIGGARTALFSWLFAQHHGGKFLLRIEDTDRKRSTQDAVEAIIEGMKWLELNWDGEPVSQFACQERHAAVAHKLLEDGKAYRCYCSPQELTDMREKAKAEGRPVRYDGRWRDRSAADAPKGIDPVIRLKAPLEGETIVEDKVQGTIRVENSQLDDMILLRSDGTPTYMLSVVVDDHDMAVTHVIRGDDHLTNTFRQSLLYDAMGWEQPVFAHLPLIFGPDGTKLSKRHGAVGVEAYAEMGYLPEAMRNYLLRLGWSHGDDEIISTEQAIEWFNLDSIGKSPARFDFDRLGNLNMHYMKQSDPAALVEMIVPRLEVMLDQAVDDTARARLLAGMPALTERAQTLTALAEAGAFYARQRPLPLTEKAAGMLDDEARARLAQLRDALAALTDFTTENIEQALRDFAETSGIKLGQIAQPFRAALTGTTASPSIFQAAAILGQEEVLGRIDDVLV